MAVSFRQMNEGLCFTGGYFLCATSSYQIKIAFNFVFIFTHLHWHIEDKTVAAELFRPSGTGHMTDAKFCPRKSNSQSQLPRVAVKFVNRDVIACGANLSESVEPSAKPS